MGTLPKAPVMKLKDVKDVLYGVAVLKTAEIALSKSIIG